MQTHYYFLLGLPRGSRKMPEKSGTILCKYFQPFPSRFDFGKFWQFLLSHHSTCVNPKLGLDPGCSPAGLDFRYLFAIYSFLN